MMVTIDDAFDDFLNIHTQVQAGVDDETERSIFFGYGVTSYHFLERLFQLFPFKEQDHLVDFGCGKGRVLFMASAYHCQKMTGYEIDKKRYDIVMENLEKYQNKHGTVSCFDIRNEDVQNATIDDTANKFFFFDPFHLKIYVKVIKNIEMSLQRKERNISLFFYNPNPNTIEFLDSINWLQKNIFINADFCSEKIKASGTQFAFYCNYDFCAPVNQYSFYF